MAFTLLLAVALGAQAEPPAETRPPAARTVYFAVDAAVLDSQAREILDGVAQWLHVNPTIQIVIEGHADARGTSAHNRALAARRAEAVRDWLAHRGILASRLSTISFGEDRPALYDYGESVWMMNRRVEIRAR
jgi:peptidoglycan-associated lipoprotein